MALHLHLMKGDATSPGLGADAKVTPRNDDWIGRHLRRVYKDVLEEPLPDSLAELLRRIGEPTGKTVDKGGVN